ncbi:MAG TPA: peptidoglycan-binding protein LysM, partial [Flavobacteriia bacterium]|nr:peptidoglycan-binding protein LysM [Flavobacteriia bacterium]
MGLFSFIKDAGAKLFGGKTSEEETNELAAQRAEKLRKAIEDMGFKVTDLDIEVDGDTVTVYGEAEDQATK